MSRQMLAPVLLAAVLPACGGEVTIDEFIAQYPDAYCAYHLHCCAADEQSYNSVAACRLSVSLDVASLLAFSNEATPGATFDAAAARSCLDRLQGQDCSDAGLVKGCAEEAARPRQDQGQPCRHSAECKTYFCDQPQVGAQGVCGGQAVIGGKCSGDDRACPLGSYCSISAICAAEKQAGASCNEPGHCQSGICHRSQRLCANASRTPICQGR
jgi:hypothetical protein